jgi:hypothetical protein
VRLIVKGMKGIYKGFLIWLMGTRFYSWLLLSVIPYIRFTTYYTSFRGWKYHRGYPLLRPGDIVLCKDKKKLTSLLVPGIFTHACQCVDVGSEWEISEMDHLGYVKSTFFDVCKESDRIVILRCNDYDADYTEKVIAKCKSLLGSPYNVEFKLGIPALYCSDLEYVSDIENRLQVSLEDLDELGRPYISPTGLYLAKNCTVVWDSDQEIAPPASGG